MKKIIVLAVILNLFQNLMLSQTIVQSYDTAGSYTFTVPAGVTYIKVECWGGGGGGGASKGGCSGGVKNGGGGGGGAYARIDSLPVIPLTIHSLVVGSGGIGTPDAYALMQFTTNLIATEGGNTSFDSIVVLAAGGAIGTNAIYTSTTNGIGGPGGQAVNCIGTTVHSGGDGFSGTSGVTGAYTEKGGGGGGSGGVDSVGHNAGIPDSYYGGIAVADGGGGGNGSHGYISGSGPGSSGTAPGGGGGGGNSARVSWGGDDCSYNGGGNGADGKVRITYTIPTTVGINEITNHHSQITIFPNPFTSTTTITFSEEQKNTSLKITDVLGNVILQSKINNKQYTIDLAGYAKGIYFVQITDEKKNIVNRKIIVQ